jgi:hypothetical protein
MIKTRIVGMLPDIFKSVGRRRTAGLLLQSVLAWLPTAQSRAKRPPFHREYQE